MKKYPTIKYLERICKTCKHSKEIHGKRFCTFIMPNFERNGICKDYDQTPKHIEKYEQLSLFEEI